MPARNTNIDAGREEITRLYLSGVGPKEIANSFNVSLSVIGNRLREWDVISNAKRVTMVVEQNKEEIISLYSQEGMPARKIASLFSVSQGVVLRNLKKWGIERSRGKDSRIINHGAFSTITPKSAYWIGFIVGDGTINNGRNEIAISSKDKEHIEKFKNFLGSRKNIYQHEISEKQYYRLAVTSRLIASNLLKMGITPKKSLTIKIEENYKSILLNPHFLRGLIDSDGHIRRMGVRTEVSLFTGSLQFGIQVEESIKLLTGYSPRVYEKKKRNGYSIRICHTKKAVEFLSLLYECPLDIALERKHRQAKDAIQAYFEDRNRYSVDTKNTV